MKYRAIVAIATLLLTITARAEDFALGVGCHFGSSNTGDVEANLALFEQAGLNAMRDERAWQFVEWVKGDVRFFKNGKIERAFERVHSRGGTVVNGLWYGSPHYGASDYPRTPENIEAFCRYAEFVTKETRGIATFQQVWNEWDTGTGMPAAKKDTADYGIYAELLKAVAPRIRAADPDVKIMSNSATMVFKLEFMLKAGVLDHVDALAFHPYVDWRGPGNDNVEYWYHLMLEAGKLLEPYNRDKKRPMYITELGWPSSMVGSGITEEQQSVIAAQMLLLVRSFPFVKGLMWYDFQDDGVNVLNKQFNFGLIRADATPKPLYYIFADLSRLVRTGTFVERVDVRDPKVIVLKFRMGERDVLAMWNWHAHQNTEITFRNKSQKPEPIAMRHAGRQAVSISWGRTNWLKQEPRRENELCFTLRDMPLLIEGNLSELEILSVRQIDFRRDPAATPAPKPRPSQLY